MVQETVRSSICIKSRTENLPLVRQFITRMIRASLLPPVDENRVILAVDEAVSNIIEHGYGPERRDARIDVEVAMGPKRFAVTVRDSGVSFDPETAGEVDMPQHISEGRRKGLGIFLVRKIMDEVVYVFREGSRNELHLVKYIQDKQTSVGEA